MEVFNISEKKNLIEVNKLENGDLEIKPNGRLTGSERFSLISFLEVWSVSQKQQSVGELNQQHIDLTTEEKRNKYTG